MMHMLGFDPHHLITLYGAWAVFLVVGLESVGLPLPGETLLVAAAVYAGTAGGLDISHVLVAASAGAFLGDNAGYWIGRRLGLPLLSKHGGRVGIDARRLKLGRYLFDRHGGKVVFFGRFVALLRTLAALLAGVNRMPWPRFLAFNLAGGVLWSLVFGLGGYALGHLVERLAGPIGLGLLGVGAVVALFGFVALRRAEASLMAKAEETFAEVGCDQDRRRPHR